MKYLGDFAEDATARFMWNSSGANGASITRTVNGTISVYKDGGTTQSTAGITDTEDYDGLTGVHYCEIDLSADAFYAAGADYSVVLSGATIDGQTVNAVLAEFSIENRFHPLDAPLKNAVLADIPFYMVDNSDHVTPETGLSVTAEMSQDGGSFEAVNGSVTEVGSGVYHLDASAEDMNADYVLFKFTAAGADAVLVGIKTRS